MAEPAVCRARGSGLPVVYLVNWLKRVAGDVLKLKWNAKNTIRLMIEGGFSFRQMDLMRRFLSLVFDADADRYFHPVMIQAEGGGSRDFIRWLEPIAPRATWWPVFQAAKGELKIEMNADGSIASRDLLDVTVEMFEEHRAKGMLKPGAGESTATPADAVLMFDGFPCDALSICHTCVADASLKDELSDQSEQLLKMVSAGAIKETNGQLTENFQHKWPRQTVQRGGAHWNHSSLQRRILHEVVGLRRQEGRRELSWVCTLQPLV